MSSSSADLLDLKLLPTWATEPARPNEYSNFAGEEVSGCERRERGPQRNREASFRSPRPHDARAQRRDRQTPRRGSDAREERHNRPEPVAALPSVGVHFLPRPAALDSVTAQIKSDVVAYSVFALARLFLEKPERYDVHLVGTAETFLYQLGENGPVATDRGVLENVAFTAMREVFYEVETKQAEPLKGNFSNVARCRLSGTLLGPTNHHNYQPQLRSLYEQRFSRRMSFADYQKQVEIVSNPAVVEEWKEQARNVTLFRTKAEEAPVTFSSAAEAERHFRQLYLPDLIRASAELTIDGVTSRRLPDRGLGRVIEQAWADETRSPSKMMQELAGALRTAGLNIFRHRRGMLFVSRIRVRAFGHERTGVSASINSILEKIQAAPGIKRKQLADQIAPAGGEAAEVERAKRTLASDLHWLVSEGYVIEFNDSSLDLPRTKAPARERPVEGPARKEGAATPVASEAALPAFVAEPADGLAEDEVRETTLTAIQPPTTSSEEPDSAPSERMI
ncbi:MAG: hypothetical protein ABI871_07885 [Chthoniobacterales bacterium]